MAPRTRRSKRRCRAYRDYINRWRQAISGEAARRAAAPVSRPAADGADAGDGGADSGEDAASAARRQHALEYAQTRSPAEDSSQSRRQSVAARRAAAASLRAVHAIGRSGLRDEGGGRDWAVCESARPRGGVRRRRENGDPGARSPRSGAAAVAWPRRAARLRVLPAWHALAAGRARHAIRRSARPDRAPTHQRRVCRIPRRHRGQPAEADGRFT